MTTESRKLETGEEGWVFAEPVATVPPAKGSGRALAAGLAADQARRADLAARLGRWKSFADRALVLGDRCFERGCSAARWALTFVGVTVAVLLLSLFQEFSPRLTMLAAYPCMLLFGVWMLLWATSLALGAIHGAMRWYHRHLKRQYRDYFR